MATYLTEDSSAETVIARINDEECSPRFREIMEGLIRHLHTFIKDVSKRIH